MDILLTDPIEFIDSNEKLERICDRLIQSKFLAIDTEFMRSQTYFPKAGLLQINDGQCTYLIDPLKVDDYYPLVEVFDDPQIIKFVHAASEDIEVFHSTVGCVPNSLIDTQIAAAVCGIGFSIGFAGLVSQLLEIDLPKTETRSDWLARPLSQPQIQYAAMDVEFLYEAAQKIMERVDELGRRHWLVQDSDDMVRKYFFSQQVENAVFRFKNAWRLNSRQYTLLKSLATWRETVVQSKDVPRNRFLKEHMLQDIAELMPDHIAQLRDLQGLSERVIKRYGDDIIRRSADVIAISEELLLNVPVKPLTSTEKKRLVLAREFVESMATEMEVPSAFLLKKKQLDILVRASFEGCDIPDLDDGWRNEIVIYPLFKYLINL